LKVNASPNLGSIRTKNNGMIVPIYITKIEELLIFAKPIGFFISPQIKKRTSGKT